MGVHRVSQPVDHGPPSIGLKYPFQDEIIWQFTGEVRPNFSNKGPLTGPWKKIEIEAKGIE